MSIDRPSHQTDRNIEWDAATSGFRVREEARVDNHSGYICEDEVRTESWQMQWDTKSETRLSADPSLDLSLIIFSTIKRTSFRLLVHFTWYYRGQLSTISVLNASTYQ